MNAACPAAHRKHGCSPRIPAPLPSLFPSFELKRVSLDLRQHNVPAVPAMTWLVALPRTRVFMVRLGQESNQGRWGCRTRGGGELGTEGGRQDRTSQGDKPESQRGPSGEPRESGPPRPQAFGAQGFSGRIIHYPVVSVRFAFARQGKGGAE